MSKELFKFIQELSIKDPKTLMQKALKTAEECGELAKAVLPYTEAPQSNHKFTDKNKILEESCDVILCALSVAYNLGMNQEQIEAMLWKKSEYWSSLQERETNNPYPLPFELHVTVSKDSDIEKFKKVCKDINVKAICLDLINKEGDRFVDEVMTSSKFYGNNSEVYIELCRITNALTNEGFLIEREKIETVYWHPSAPSSKNGNNKMHKNGYFEAHVDCFIHNDKRKKLFLSDLNDLAREYNAVISQNTKKIFEDGSVYILTLRNSNTDAESFVEKIKKLELDLKKYELMNENEKPMIEFAIYDTKVSHDKEWINNK